MEGDWDVMDDVANPFLYEWADEKHIDDSVQLNRNVPVHVSVDFNINPLCALVIQHVGRGAVVVDEIKIEKGSVDAFCDAVLALGVPMGLIRITGDAMGKGGTVQQRDNSSAYTQIKRRLGMSDSQFLIPAPYALQQPHRLQCCAAQARHPRELQAVQGVRVRCEASAVRC